MTSTAQQPMNRYAAPGTQAHAEPPDEVTDIASSSPPFIARVAGGVVALSGALVALTGAQTLAIVTIRGALWVFPWALVVLGIAQLVLSAQVFRARGVAVMLAIASSAVLVLGAGAWLFLSLSQGFFQLYAFGGPSVSLAAVVMGLIALGPSRRASAARARLRERGMDLGI
jgi:hypothetical protein